MCSFQVERCHRYQEVEQEEGFPWSRPSAACRSPRDPELHESLGCEGVAPPAERAAPGEAPEHTWKPPPAGGRHQGESVPHHGGLLQVTHPLSLCSLLCVYMLVTHLANDPELNDRAVY